MKRKGAPRCVDNVLKAVDLFLSNKKVSTVMMKEELGVSLRTAQRYINDISAIMCVTRTDDGAYCLPEKQTGNGLPENDALLAEAFYAAACKIAPEDKSGYLRSLRRVMGIPERNAVHVAEMSEDYNKIKKTASLIRKAIKECVSLSFLYDRNGEGYTVSPYRLIINEGFWYLAAYSDGKVKTFRLDFIKDAAISADEYVKPTPEINEAISELTTVWTSKDALTVRVVFDDEIADYFSDGQKLKISKVISQKPFEADVTVGHIMELYQKLMPFTPYYEIISPDVREFFRINLENGALRHINKETEGKNK